MSSYSLSFSPDSKAPFPWKFSEAIKPIKNPLYYSVSSISLEKNLQSTVKKINYEDMPTIYKVIKVVKIIFCFILIGIPIVIISNLIAKSISEKYRKKYNIPSAIEKFHDLENQRKIEEKILREKKEVQEKLIKEKRKDEEKRVGNIFTELLSIPYKKYNGNAQNFSNANDFIDAIEIWLENDGENIKTLAFSNILLDDIDNSSFKALSKLLNLFPNLEKLDLTNTKIKYFDFRKLKNLTVDLSHNDIEKFNKENFSLGNAENLKIILDESPFFEDKELGRHVINTDKTYFTTVGKIKKNMEKENFENCKNVEISIHILKTARMGLRPIQNFQEKPLNTHFNAENQNNVTFKITTEKFNYLEAAKTTDGTVGF